MKDMQDYLQAMSKSVPDKAWGLSKVDSDVDTIIDFGCATGDLYKYAQALYPNRFKYIGIDNSPEMLAQAKERFPTAQFLTSIKSITEIDWNKAILIMNSVCHEIYSYCHKTTLGNLLRYVQQQGIRHIAIRDMFLNGSTDTLHLDLDTALQKRYSPQYKDNKQLGRNAYELVMKYTYLKNWTREVKEQYFHPYLLEDIRQSLTADYTMSVTHFFIPQQIARIEKDLGVIWDNNTTTHVKLWITRG